ncbi:MAG: molybdopterin-guanine dinucleotide biosynthesis protein MobB, partial [Dehalococcoidales bacterium]|nr:molybdopterin-guanine dinucleotide biosynthesis protein MobB [Dehalococcoidales bacterium]
MSFDKPGKDTWRYLEAGSAAAVASAQDRLVLISPSVPQTLDGIARVLGEDCDLILAEGFKQGDAPKIEVHRREVGPLLSGLKKLLAVVTDEPLDTKARQFGFDDVKALADLLETGFIKPQRERLSIYVNGASLPLSTFPKEFMTNVLLAMAASLKGVGKVKSLDVFLRRGEE